MVGRAAPVLPLSGGFFLWYRDRLLAMPSSAGPWGRSETGSGSSVCCFAFRCDRYRDTIGGGEVEVSSMLLDDFKGVPRCASRDLSVCCIDDAPTKAAP